MSSASVLRATCRPKPLSPYFASWIPTRHRSYAKEIPASSQFEEPNLNVETFSSKARPPASSPWTRISDQVNGSCRSFATEQLPRPPPTSSEPAVTTFENTSKPRPYGRPPPRVDLPLQKVSHLNISHRIIWRGRQKRWPIITAFIVAGVAGWAAFLLIAANQEKLSSSVVRQILRMVKNNEELKNVLGEAIRPQPEWWLNGDPWISGAVSSFSSFATHMTMLHDLLDTIGFVLQINMLQGNVDVSFRLKGHKGAHHLTSH